MYHKISDMCDKIDLIKKKADELRRMKYDPPGPYPDFERESCNMMVADIQALCREVAHDQGEYSSV